MDDDKFHDECAVMGVYGHPEAANLTYLGLYAQQHRGQESTGIVASDQQSFHVEVGMGLVNDFFNEERLSLLRGTLAIGHNRYSTTGSSSLRNAQPLAVDYARGSLAIAHNGNLVNAHRLRSELEAHGSIFRSTSDTEVVLHLIAQSQAANLVDCVVEALQQVQGAYSLLVLRCREMFAVRDPYGLRPMSLGQFENGGYVVASETCAFELIEATYLRDIQPGELVRFSADGVQSYFPFPPAPERPCIFELVYFARTDSDMFGHNVYMMRKAFGAQLAEEAPVEADVVIPVPDSGIPAALGYAEASGIPFDTGLTRNHYVGRTFIEPQQSIRNFGVKIKLSPNRSCLGGKRVVVVDDSIVRGTTSQKLMQMIRHAGAKEVHLRISSPPTTHSCVYGIATPTSDELIASSHSVDEIRDYIQADSLAYLSHEGMMQMAYADEQAYCSACFTGDYPIQIPRHEDVVQLPLFGQS